MGNGTGYISAALLARFDANETFPRLPFEPIDKETYDRHSMISESYRDALPVIFKKDQVDFLEVLAQYDSADYELKGASGCEATSASLKLKRRRPRVDRRSDYEQPC